MKKRIYMFLLLLIFGLLTACSSVPADDASLPDSIKDTAPTGGEPSANISSTNELDGINTEYLPWITVDDGYCVTDYAEYIGEDYQYKIYELENEANATEHDRDIYWEITVFQNETAIVTLRKTPSEYAMWWPEASDLVLETDVNFDGQNDILFCCGHFGAQGLVLYECYLNNENEFIACPSFSDIANPALDFENHVVLSSWRNWAASHSFAKYYWIDGVCVESERLTEEIQTVDGSEIWTWTDEIFTDGEWQIREYFTENDYDKETLHNKIYGTSSRWGIDQDKWRTLYNDGLMSDFSIYNSK